MKNPIFQLYEKTDDVIMYCVNKSVKAWNWTTGQTKADLANSLLTIAPVSEVLGYSIISPVLGVGMSFPFLLVSHLDQKRNKKQEILEEKALEKGLKLDSQSSHEGAHRGFGLAWAGDSVYEFYLGFNYDSGFVISGAGHVIRSSSYYVMRADYLPPRKNVFSRTKDKLVEKLQEVNLEPAPQHVSLE